MTQAEAIDLATLENMGNMYEHDGVIGYGQPVPIYIELWYKLMMSPKSTMYTASVWNMGGNYYEPWPYPDDEYIPPPPAIPGYNYRSIVTVYDASNNVITSGTHVEFTNLNRKNTWVYFKVTQPTHWPYPIVCVNRLRVAWVDLAGSILPSYICVQDENPNGVVYVHPTGFYNYASPMNLAFPEDGHSVYGSAGDVLFSGITCIVDNQANCITVRDRNYRNPIFIPNVGNNVHHIKRNADGYRNFWVSYTVGGVNKVAPVDIVHDASYNLVSATLGAPLGITDIVDRMCARADQMLYYVVRGTTAIRRWDMIKNVAYADLIDYPSLGTITDILILPDGNLLVGYNTGMNPTIFTIRRYDAVTGAMIRDYIFYSNNTNNRINYAESIDAFYAWTHEVIGESTVRKIKLDNGSVISTSIYREYEVGKLIIDKEMYNADGTQGHAIQKVGFTNKFNFWITPVRATPTGAPVNGGGLMEVITYPFPPDDEYYPPVFTFPPILVYPPSPDGSPVFPTPPDPTPPPEVPPYPGYPWFPPPPGSNPIPPAVLPMPLKIGGGLIVIDPSNKTRHDVYLDQQGNPMPVPVVVTIRTAFLGD